MKEFYAKYLPSLITKPFKVNDKTKFWNKYRFQTFCHTKHGMSIYLGNGKAIKAQLFLCSTVYKKGDTVKIIIGKEIKDVTLVKSGLTEHKKKYWTVKENKNWYYEEFTGIQHFKIIAQISQFACWVEEFSAYNDENCFFDEYDISIIGKSRGAHDDGSYNLCLIKCPTCENLH